MLLPITQGQAHLRSKNVVLQSSQLKLASTRLDMAWISIHGKTAINKHSDLELDILSVLRVGTSDLTDGRSLPRVDRDLERSPGIVARGEATDGGEAVRPLHLGEF